MGRTRRWIGFLLVVCVFLLFSVNLFLNAVETINQKAPTRPAKLEQPEINVLYQQTPQRRLAKLPATLAIEKPAVTAVKPSGPTANVTSKPESKPQSKKTAQPPVPSNPIPKSDVAVDAEAASLEKASKDPRQVGCRYERTEGKFLRGYPHNVQNHFTSLSAALKRCGDLGELCGGVTRQHGLYEVRAGRTLEKEQSSVVTWVKHCGPVRVEPGTPAETLPMILVLTPIKRSARHMDRYFGNLRKLAYPKTRLVLAFFLSDDEAGTGTDSALLEKAKPGLLAEGFGGVEIHHKDYGYELPKDRHSIQTQLVRRAVLARSRNALVAAALREEEHWVLWIDVDVNAYPTDVIQQLLSAHRSVVVPNVVMKAGGRSYDLNSWGLTPAKVNGTPRKNLLGLASDVVLILEACGRDAVRDPKAVKMELQTASKKLESGWLHTAESIRQLSERQWGHLDLPVGLVNCIRNKVKQPVGRVNRPVEVSGVKGDLHLEGYKKDTDHLSLSMMRKMGEMVELQGVGGAVLLVRAELHREGLAFPSYPYNHRIETEGLAMMARDMGYKAWGMPNLEVIHL